MMFTHILTRKRSANNHISARTESSRGTKTPAPGTDGGKNLDKRAVRTPRLGRNPRKVPAPEKDGEKLPTHKAQLHMS